MTRVAIIGSGFGGIAAAVQLLEAGVGVGAADATGGGGSGHHDGR